MPRIGYKTVLKVHKGIFIPYNNPACFISRCLTPQVDNGKQQEHEQNSMMEHLRLMLGVLSSVRVRSDAVGEWQEDSGLGLYRGPEDTALPGVQASAGGPGMQQKMTALENIVCVLNREVERTALTLEALSRQHRLDQEKIENLSNKVLTLH